MNEVQPQGAGTCAAACAGICLAGCAICLADGPIFIADTATGGTSLASGTAAGLST